MTLLRPAACMAAALFALPWVAIAAWAAPPSSVLPPASAPPPAGGGPIGPAAPLARPAAAPGAAMPSPVPPTAETTAAVPPPVETGSTVATPEVPAAPRVVVTGDVAPSESDHDAVVGTWGVEVRPVTTTLPVFNRRATTGCPLAPVASSTSTPTSPSMEVPDCPAIGVGMLGVRHWVNRNLGLNGGVALALGGGKQGDRLLDSYFGFGPAVGLSILLGNWRHLSVAASPALSLVWFKAAGSAAVTYVADLRADLEGELHFGFIGVPALSLGIRSGVALRLEKAADLTLWSAGVSGVTTPRGLVSDLTLRYYF